MSQADPTTREEALERRVAYLDDKRERALAALEDAITSFQAEAGNHHNTARKQAFADCAAALEPIREVHRDP